MKEFEFKGIKSFVTIFEEIEDLERYAVNVREAVKGFWAKGEELTPPDHTLTGFIIHKFVYFPTKEGEEKSFGEEDVEKALSLLLFTVDASNKRKGVLADAKDPKNFELYDVMLRSQNGINIVYLQEMPFPSLVAGAPGELSGEPESVYWGMRLQREQGLIEPGKLLFSFSSLADIADRSIESNVIIKKAKNGVLSIETTFILKNNLFRLANIAEKKAKLSCSLSSTKEVLRLTERKLRVLTQALKTTPTLLKVEEVL